LNPKSSKNFEKDLSILDLYMSKSNLPPFLSANAPMPRNAGRKPALQHQAQMQSGVCCGGKNKLGGWSAGISGKSVRRAYAGRNF